MIYYIISQCVAYLLCLVALIHLKPKGFASLSFLAGNDSLLLAFLYTHAPISKKERKKNLELVSFFFKYPLLNFDVLYSKFLVFRHVFPAQNLPQLKFSKLIKLLIMRSEWLWRMKSGKISMMVMVTVF